MLGSEESLRSYRDRFGFFQIIIGVLLGSLFLRLFYLQVIRGSELKQYSENNRIRQEKIPAPRGIIYDHEMNILVDNVPSFDITLTPQFAGNIKETIRKVSELLHIPKKEIETVIDRSRTQPSFLSRVIRRDVTRDMVALVLSHKLDLPSVDVDVRIKRLYKSGKVGSQMLGYVGEVSKDEIESFRTQGLSSYRSGDIVGKDGIEAQVESFLRGEDGKRFVEVDARGHRKNISSLGRPLLVYPEVESSPGNNVILTVDQELQQIAYDAFADKSGAAVAVDLRSGAIRVMLSQPSYDPTILSSGTDRNYLKEIMENEFHPFGNKTIQDHQSPGSTFKVVTAIAGLEEQVVTPDTRFYCGGRMRFGGRWVHCHREGGHGEVSFHTALVRSCNIYFYNLAMKLGIDRLAKYARALGLGSSTGIELGREIAGLIPDSEWKLKKTGEPWQEGETLSIAIGQGFTLVTPLQLAMVYGALATGGKLFKPYLVKEIRSPTDSRLLRPEPQPTLRKVSIQPATLERVRKALYGVVNEESGTMWWYRLKGGQMMSGKTGTTQTRKIAADQIYKKCEALPFKERRHAWFVGYAPSDNPELVVAVLAEHACHGGSGAGPVAAAIFRGYFDKQARGAQQTATPPVAPPATAALTGGP